MTAPDSGARGGIRIVACALRSEEDVVHARQVGRTLAAELGFSLQDQTRISTAVSEIARNAVSYGGGGTVDFALDARMRPQRLAVEVRDDGPGIRDLARVLEGEYESPTGMGLGIVGSRRLVDEFAIESAPGRGTRVRLAKYLPPDRTVRRDRLGTIGARLAARERPDPLGELRAQSREILASLAELRRREDELDRIAAELDNTNRGVVALHAELEEKAESLRRASEMKSRFISNVSHELRTPINAIIAMSGLLLDRMDGELAPEQERQIAYIRQSGRALAELINDLLDIAKIEAGKVELRIETFAVDALLAELRGTLRPLRRPDVELVLDCPPGAGCRSDRGKVAQVLRNLVSNALKFTERGSVTVTAQPTPDGGIGFAVADTGIGIPADKLTQIFEEFVQVENPLQVRAKGTGLGLALCRQLANLLGGSIDVESTLGRGSTFRLVLPAAPPDRHPDPLAAPAAPPDPGPGAAPRTDPDPGPPSDRGAAGPDGPAPRARPARAPAPAGAAPAASAIAASAIVVDDDPAIAHVIAQRLREAGVAQVYVYQSGIEGLAALRALRPDLAVVDLNIPDLAGDEILRDLKADPETCDIPVAIVTSAVLTPARLRTLAAAAGVWPKDDLTRGAVRDILVAAARAPGGGTA